MSMQDIQEQQQKLQKTEKWEGWVGKSMVASILVGYASSGTVSDIAGAIASISVVGYLSLSFASSQQKKEIEKRKKEFVHMQGADKNIRQYDDLDKREKKIRRTRAVIFAAGVATGVAGTVATKYLGHPEMDSAALFIGIVVGTLASALTSLKELTSIKEQKTSSVTALEARRAQMRAEARVESDLKWKDIKSKIGKNG